MDENRKTDRRHAGAGPCGPLFMITPRGHARTSPPAKKETQRKHRPLRTHASRSRITGTPPCINAEHCIHRAAHASRSRITGTPPRINTGHHFPPGTHASRSRTTSHLLLDTEQRQRPSGKVTLRGHASRTHLPISGTQALRASRFVGKSLDHYSAAHDGMHHDSPTGIRWDQRELCGGMIPTTSPNLMVAGATILHPATNIEAGGT
jgi:hypothetical protein